MELVAMSAYDLRLTEPLQPPVPPPLSLSLNQPEPLTKFVLLFISSLITHNIVHVHKPLFNLKALNHTPCYYKQTRTRLGKFLTFLYFFIWKSSLSSNIWISTTPVPHWLRTSFLRECVCMRFKPFVSSLITEIWRWHKSPCSDISEII